MSERGEFSDMYSALTSDAGVEGSSGSSPVKVQSYEFRRDRGTGAWESIKVGSLDWHEITSSHVNALVVRVSSIVNENEPDEVMERLHSEDFAADAPQPALHVVCMFKEFAVSESSPVRYTANFLFIFPTLGDAKPSQFKAAIRSVLTDRSISYITAEMLASFLARRDYEAHAITKQDAQDKLAKFIHSKEPCSSFFLKMSPVVPEFCRLLLLELSEDDARELVGVRAIHKLAISCTSSSMASQHNFSETMAVMKIGVHPNHWNFVVFKTLMRLATKNDRISRNRDRGSDPSTQVDQMLDLILNSHLDPLEKLAVRIISSSDDPSAHSSHLAESSNRAQHEQHDLVNFMVRIITSEKDYLSNEDFKRLLNMIEDGRPAACHLTGVLLEKCIEEENFNIGWRVASTVESVNEHTIEEVVTLCSKAFFKYSRNQQQEANKWFNRVKWCFERHHKLLGKYPSGLALHVAAHRRDFELCWRWFQAKKEDRAFRFSAHHTSSILKAASYALSPSLHMKEVLQAYEMTPGSQKSAFVFEPLVHLWNATHDCRDECRIFWVSIQSDLRTYLDKELKQSDPIDRKMRKLTNWERVLSDWSTVCPELNLMEQHAAGDYLSIESQQLPPQASGNSQSRSALWTNEYQQQQSSKNTHWFNGLPTSRLSVDIGSPRTYGMTSPSLSPSPSLSLGDIPSFGSSPVWSSTPSGSAIDATFTLNTTPSSKAWPTDGPVPSALTLDASAESFRPYNNNSGGGWAARTTTQMLAMNQPQQKWANATTTVSSDKPSSSSWPARGPSSSSAAWPHAVGLPL